MRTITLMMAAVTALAISACSKGDKSSQDETPQEKNSKVLVAYFSATGITKGVAQQLAEVTGGDLFEIQPEQPYTDADLDWTNKQSRSTVEMQDKQSRPAIANKVDNMEDYSTVYLGFPIWWYTCPTIINTFMEAYDLKGKTVIPFATSGGSDISKACADLKETYPDVGWQEGRLLNSPTKEELTQWVGK